MKKPPNDGIFQQKSPVVTEVAARAPPSGKLLRRGDVARILGVSHSSVRRMEGTTLTPIIGEDGVRYFAAEEIEAVFVRVRRGVATTGSRKQDSVAADAFALFRDGKNPADVVQQLGVEPAVIESLHATWTRWQQTVVIRGDQLETVRRLFPGQTLAREKALVDAVRELRAASCVWCERCRANPTHYCLDCARQAAVHDLAEEESSRLF